MKRARTSEVWAYFTIESEEKKIAICNICQQKCSFNTTISNLNKHVKRKHVGVSSSKQMRDKAVASIGNKTKSMASLKYFEPLDLEKGEATCKICNTTIFYDYMSDLKQHIQDHGQESSDSDEESVPEVSAKRIRKKQSKLWEVFRPTTDKMAECLICHNLFNYGTTISNLRRHLMRKHGDLSLLSKDGESKNIITYNGELYEIMNGQDDDDDAPKEMDAVYLNEEELDDDSTIYKPPSPKKTKLSIPSKFKPKITKEQIHSTKYNCSEEPELPSNPIPKYTPNSMGSLDYFGQYVVSLLKELPKPVSDQLQSEIIKQILTSKMALVSQTVVAKYEILRSQNNETDKSVPEPISYTVVQSNESADKLNESTESVVKE